MQIAGATRLVLCSELADAKIGLYHVCTLEQPLVHYGWC